MKKHKIYEYKGYKIQNSPHKSKSKWIIYDLNMERIKTYPKATLKECKECIDAADNKLKLNIKGW